MRRILISIFCILTQFIFGQKIHDVNFDYIEKIDQSWDSTAYNGSLKMNKIDILYSQLTEMEIQFNDTIKAIIKEETNRQLEDLKSTYSNEGISQSLTTKLTNKISYKFGTATLTVFEHSVDFEYTKIITLLIIDNNEHLLYSRTNKLGLDIEIKSVWKSNDEYLIYGISSSNPEFKCGGNFKLIFKGNDRLIKYSYCEENN